MGTMGCDPKTIASATMHKPPTPPAVRAYLLWLVLACLLPGVLGASLLFASQYRQTRDHLEGATVLTTRAMAQAVDNYILRVQSVAQTLAASPDLQEGNLAKFHEDATRTMQRLGLGTNVVLRDARGHQLLNTAVPWGEPLAPPAAPDQVREVFATGRPTVSGLFTGPVMRRAVVGVNVPVMLDGRVRYALGIGVLPAQLSALLEQQQMPVGWVASIVDEQDIIVARSRLAGQFVGRTASLGFQAQVKGQTESTGESINAEGMAVFLIHTTSALTRWRIAIGIPRGAVDEAFRRTASQIAAGIALMFGLGAALAWRLGGRISCAFDELKDAAHDLGAGRPVSQTQPQVQEAQVVHETMREAARLLEMRDASLREADRRKDEFIAVLAHELRNPLAPVRTAVEVLRRAQPGDAGDVRARRVIERQVAHMSRLIDDLLDVARIARGKMSLTRERCDLGRIVRQVAHDWWPQIHEAGLQVDVSAPPQPVWIDADPVRVARMLTNLINNAVRFTERGGLLRLAAGVDENAGTAWMRVADTGVGIEPQVMARLFDPFAQASQDFARTKGGLGLGLALTRSLAKLHGGRVEATSAGLGQGATFTVWLPRAPAPASLAPEPATAPSQSPPP